MPQISKTGIYIGRVVKHTLSRPKMCIQFCARLEAKAMIDEATDAVVQLPEPQHIMAWLSLTKLDGDRNQSQKDALMQAFGWDGKSLAALHAMKLDDKEVSFTVSEEEGQDGGMRLRVGWINPVGGGFKRATDAEVADFDKEWQAIPEPGAEVPAADGTQLPAEAAAGAAGPALDGTDEIPF